MENKEQERGKKSKSKIDAMRGKVNEEGKEWEAEEQRGKEV